MYMHVSPSRPLFHEGTLSLSFSCSFHNLSPGSHIFFSAERTNFTNICICKSMCLLVAYVDMHMYICADAGGCIYICVNVYVHTCKYMCVRLHRCSKIGVVTRYMQGGLVQNFMSRFLSPSNREVGGWGRVPFSRNLMSPTPRRKWYLTTGRRFH